MLSAKGGSKGKEKDDGAALLHTPKDYHGDITDHLELPPYLVSDGALDEFLLRFREGTLPKGEWTHAAHIAMAADYSLRYDVAECLERARRDIRHFNESVGGKNTEDGGYHETLTVFWLGVVRDFLKKQSRDAPRLRLVQQAVAAFAPQRDLFKRFYSFDVVGSREARKQWVPPDCEN